MNRVGMVSFMHESNTFNPTPTTLEMFENTALLFGDAIQAHSSQAHHEVGGMLEMIPQLGAQIVPLVMAWAMPSGVIQEDVYEKILNAILTHMKGQPLDGLLLSLHGAMVAEHVRDADGFTTARIRRAVGPDFPIVLTLDLHANVSPQMVSNVTATILYRSNPHLDQRDRGCDAARLMVEILDGKIRPVQALAKPPQLVPILAQRTDSEPMAGLYRRLGEIAGMPGVLSAGIALGFPYADVEEMGLTVLVVADGNEEIAAGHARDLAVKAWELRTQWNRTGTPISEAIRQAAEADKTPVTLLDVGDNIGGGSPGNGTAIFEAIQMAGIENALVVLCDPEAVRSCLQAGVGQNVTLDVGGTNDGQHGRSVTIVGKVKLLSDGLFVERTARHGGSLLNNQGLTAVVETAERHTVVLTSSRMPPFSLEQILSLGIKPESKRMLIAKGAIAPRAAYAPVSARMIEVDSPGITAANPARFDYRFRRRPMFPLETEAEYLGDFLIFNPQGNKHLFPCS